MSRIRIPPTLRTETGGAREVEADGGTVRELLEDLAVRFPTLGERIWEEGDVAEFVNVYVGGEDVRTREGLDTPVREGDTIILLPAMAGGAAACPRTARTSGGGSGEPGGSPADRPVGGS